MVFHVSCDHKLFFLHHNYSHAGHRTIWALGTLGTQLIAWKWNYSQSCRCYCENNISPSLSEKWKREIWKLLHMDLVVYTKGFQSCKGYWQYFFYVTNFFTWCNQNGVRPRVWGCVHHSNWYIVEDKQLSSMMHVTK